MDNCFATFAVILAYIFMLSLLAVFIEFILKHTIQKLRKRWLYKHRFGKVPTAMCYCKDCKNHDGLACRKFTGWNTADEWFCWDATPRDDD